MKESLNEKLALIQAELKTKKSRYNSFGKYYFRSAEDILEAIKPFLVKYGVTVTVSEELIADGVIKTSALITDGLNTYGATAIVGVIWNKKVCKCHKGSVVLPVMEKSTHLETCFLLTIHKIQMQPTHTIKNHS